MRPKRTRLEEELSELEENDEWSYDDDTNIYSSDDRQTMVNDDELSAMEEAFMRGYEDAYV